MEFIRQGDVILKKTDNIKGKQEKKKDTILAYGEVTGHKHQLNGLILESVFKNQRFVELIDDGTLVHEEHDKVEVPKGKYEVLIQRETDLAGEVRQVMD